MEQKARCSVSGFGPDVTWESGFGEGLNITTPDSFSRVSAQGAVGASQDSILYRDELGKSAVMSGLKPEEAEVLRRKHGL